MKVYELLAEGFNAAQVKKTYIESTAVSHLIDFVYILLDHKGYKSMGSYKNESPVEMTKRVAMALISFLDSIDEVKKRYPGGGKDLCTAKYNHLDGTSGYVLLATIDGNASCEIFFEAGKPMKISKAG